MVITSFFENCFPHSKLVVKLVLVTMLNIISVIK